MLIKKKSELGLPEQIARRSILWQNIEMILSTKYGPQAKPYPPSAFVNKVLLTRSHPHLFTMSSISINSSKKTDGPSPKGFTIWLSQKVCWWHRGLRI